MLVRACACACPYACACMFECVYACLCVRVRVRACACVCVRARVCVYVWYSLVDCLAVLPGDVRLRVAAETGGESHVADTELSRHGQVLHGLRPHAQAVLDRVVLVVVDSCMQIYTTVTLKQYY